MILFLQEIHCEGKKGAGSYGAPSVTLAWNPLQTNELRHVYVCIYTHLGFPGGSEGKESASSAGDGGLTPGSGRSPGGGNGCPLQYSCREHPTDREAWRAAVRGVAKSQIRLSN